MPESRIKNIGNTHHGTNISAFKKIDLADIKIHPFKAFKKFTVISGSFTSSLLPLTGLYTNQSVLPAIGSELTFNDVKNIDGSLQSVTYFSINHLFYKRKTEPNNTFGPTNLNRTSKFLYESASIFSIPQIKVGEGIKPTSFSITSSIGSGVGYGSILYGTGIYGGGGLNKTLKIESDKFGNLIDSDFDTNLIISDVKYYEGFNEYFDTSRISYISNNVTYKNGIPTTSGDTKSIGKCAEFNNGYIRTSLDGLYDRYNDYSISLFITASNNDTSNDLIIAKASGSVDFKYPFKLELSGSNQIMFSAGGSTNLKTQIISTSSISDWTHVVCQKSGSYLEMYINGTKEVSASSAALQDTTSPFTQSARIDNDYPLYIGGFTNSNYLEGKLDEIRIFNKSLSSTEVGYLGDRHETGSFLQTNHIGNIFNKQAIAVVSTPNYLFDDLINTPYTASYRSTKTIHELNVLTRIDKGDFNVSSNLTLTKDDNESFKTFATSSDFLPYITTIGLYDDAGRLLAIAKTAQPIRKRPDVDMNFVVQLDLDNKVRLNDAT